MQIQRLHIILKHWMLWYRNPPSLVLNTDISIHQYKPLFNAVWYLTFFILVYIFFTVPDLFLINSTNCYQLQKLLIRIFLNVIIWTRQSQVGCILSLIPSFRYILTKPVILWPVFSWQFNYFEIIIFRFTRLPQNPNCNFNHSIIYNSITYLHLICFAIH